MPRGIDGRNAAVVPLVMQRRWSDDSVSLRQWRRARACFGRSGLPRRAGRLHKWRSLTITAERFPKTARVFSTRKQSAAHGGAQLQRLPAVGLFHGLILLDPEQTCYRWVMGSVVPTGLLN